MHFIKFLLFFVIISFKYVVEAEDDFKVNRDELLESLHQEIVILDEFDSAMEKWVELFEERPIKPEFDSKRHRKLFSYGRKRHQLFLWINAFGLLDEETEAVMGIFFEDQSNAEYLVARDDAYLNEGDPENVANLLNLHWLQNGEDGLDLNFGDLENFHKSAWRLLGNGNSQLAKGLFDTFGKPEILENLDEILSEFGKEAHRKAMTERIEKLWERFDNYLIEQRDPLLKVKIRIMYKLRLKFEKIYIKVYLVRKIFEQVKEFKNISVAKRDELKAEVLKSYEEAEEINNFAKLAFEFLIDMPEPGISRIQYQEENEIGGKRNSNVSTVKNNESLYKSALRKMGIGKLSWEELKKLAVGNLEVFEKAIGGSYHPKVPTRVLKYALFKLVAKVEILRIK